MIREFASMRFLGAICLAVLCVILTLGLWPFHVPANEVAWLGNQDGLRFGRYGTVLSSSALTMTSAPEEESGSLEIWLQPRRIWDSGTFVTFYVPEDPFRFSLRQSETDLALRTASSENPHTAATTALLVNGVFRKQGPVFLSITSGQDGTAIYIDGVPAKRSPALRLSTKEFTGRLVIGNSALQTDSWSGQLLGLAIYHGELTPTEVHEHYESWTHRGRPAITEGQRNVALYLFDEHSGNVVHDHAKSGVDLDIPEKYVVLDQLFLESPRAEFNRPGDFWGAVLKNVVGFAPLGWCFYAYFSASRHCKRPALVTVIAGALVSLTIEILQAYLPTRASGVTDLITNTLGTCIGVVSCKIVSSILAAKLPWLTVLVPARR